MEHVLKVSQLDKRHSSFYFSIHENNRNLVISHDAKSKYTNAKHCIDIFYFSYFKTRFKINCLRTNLYFGEKQLSILELFKAQKDYYFLTIKSTIK